MLRPLARLLSYGALCALLACSSSGDLRPSAWGNPSVYLEEFPLGLKQSELYAQLGAPGSMIRIGEAEIWIYRVTESEIGPRYEFEIIGGAVTNVTYRSSMGMYDGLNARSARKRAF